MSRFLVSLGLFLITNSSLIAQTDSLDSPRWVEIELINGTEHSGFFISQDDLRIRLLSPEKDTLEFLIAQIESLHYFSKASLERRFAQTRYFYSPNAFNLKQGEAYYSNTWVLVNQVSAGLTDHFTVGVGFIPLVLFEPQVLGPAWITPKFSYPIIEDQLQVSAGALIGSILGENMSFGIAYGSVTYGSIDNNLTFSGGYGRASGEWAKKPSFSLSGIIKGDEHFYLITENYYLNGELIISFGGRSDFRKVSLDYGLLGASSLEGVLIPWLGLTVPFDFGNSN